MGQIRAGSLNRRVTIEKRSSTRDAGGQLVDVWTEYATVWANVITQAGIGFVSQQFVAGGAERNRATMSFRIRYRTDITADMRIKHQGAYYEIHAVLPDLDRREYVDLGASIGVWVH